MSTFPFVQVEGALALPLTGPLACLPRSFGREWMLTPPHFSLRAELRALYAAMLRTMCLSADAFRAAVRWAPNDGPARPTPSPVAAPITQNTGPSAAPALARGAYAHRTTAAPAAPDRSKLTGGAVAIGGAALLAWIVASHTPHEVQTAISETEARPAATEAPEASQRLTNARAQHEQTIKDAGPVTPPHPTAAATVSPRVVDTTLTGAAPHVANTSAEAPANASVATGDNAREARRENTIARTQPDFGSQVRVKAATPATLVQREAHSNGRAVGRTAGQRVAGLSTSRRQSVHQFAPYREAHPVTTHRSEATYSKAKRYSPRQPAVNPADEYASILAYAKTYQPAHASNRPSIPTDSTEWVNHVSQRRVTDVPDRFAK
jgi:hypothetical protein